MAYGDAFIDNVTELEDAELMFRCEDLFREWTRGLAHLANTPSEEDYPEQLFFAWTEQRIESAALELSQRMKARRMNSRT